MSIKVGIIGGSGLDDPNILEGRQETTVTTDYGNPSDVLITGKISGIECVLLARHGRKHSIMPTNVNYRANIVALKNAGCTHVVVSTACGSLCEEVAPGTFVILDQFIDRTTKRASTLYDGQDGHPPGVCHMEMATPFNEKLRQVLATTCKDLAFPVRADGTVVTIEGPRFSSRAESHVFRSWNAHVINMTTVPEVVIANEAGLLYAAVAMATDYDCWRESTEAVTVEAVLAVMAKNAEKMKAVLTTAIPRIAEMDWTEDIAMAQGKAKHSVM